MLKSGIAGFDGLLAVQPVVMFEAGGFLADNLSRGLLTA
jgi:hypothetical protein